MLQTFNDSPAIVVVLRKLHAHTIAQHDFNIVHAHTPREMAEYFPRSFVEANAKNASLQGLYNYALEYLFPIGPFGHAIIIIETC